MNQPYENVIVNKILPCLIILVFFGMLTAHAGINCKIWKQNIPQHCKTENVPCLSFLASEHRVFGVIINTKTMCYNVIPFEYIKDLMLYNGFTSNNKT